MHPARKKRLSIILFALCGLGIAAALILTALSNNINLFYSPADIQKGKAPFGQTIRAGGLVVDGSVERNEQTLDVKFDVTDGEGTVTIYYNGILPDLFREGQGIVALGKLERSGAENGDGTGGVIRASEVLAKHDENYMPPEVAEAMANAHLEGKEKMANKAKEADTQTATQQDSQQGGY